MSDMHQTVEEAVGAAPENKSGENKSGVGEETKGAESAEPTPKAGNAPKGEDAPKAEDAPKGMTLHQMVQADGKIYAEKIADIEHILGTRIINPFGTVDPEKFKREIGEMTLSNLHSLGYKVGLKPHHDKTVMKQRLTKEFQRVCSSVRSSAPSPQRSALDPTSEAGKKALKLLQIR